MKNACKNCYWNRNNPAGSGEVCTVLPPTPFAMVQPAPAGLIGVPKGSASISVQPIHPPTTPTGECSLWRAKTADKN